MHKQRPNLAKIVYDMDYMEALTEKGKRGKYKAMAYLYYLHMLEMREDESSQHYADVWKVSKATAWAWIREFDTVIF